MFDFLEREGKKDFVPGETPLNYAGRVLTLFQTGSNGSNMQIRTQVLSLCPACQSNQISKVLESRDYERGLGEYSIFRCLNCKVCFTNPMVVEEDIHNRRHRLYRKMAAGEFCMG